jgi:plastocyanin
MTKFLLEGRGRMKWMRIVAVALVCAFGIALVACGDDDDGSGGADATTAPASTTGDAVGDGSEITVEAADFAFVPATLEAPVGEEVTIVVENTGTAPHTMTIYRDEGYSDPLEGGDTDNISAGGTAELTVTFSEGATHFFRCEIHPAQMEGTITVSRS